MLILSEVLYLLFSISSYILILGRLGSRGYTNNFDNDLKSINIQGVKDSLMDGEDHRVCQPLLKRTIKAIKGITKGAVWVHQLSSLLKVIQCVCNANFVFTTQYHTTECFYFEASTYKCALMNIS